MHGRLRRACRGSTLKDNPSIFGDAPDVNTRQRHSELCLTGIMHMKNGSIARAAAVVAATAHIVRHCACDWRRTAQFGNLNNA